MLRDIKSRNLGKFIVALFMTCAVVSPATAQTDEATLELQVWNFVLSDNSLQAYEMFVRTYPDSVWSKEAQVRIAALQSGDAVEAEPTSIDEQSIFGLLGPVTLDRPIAFGHEAILGKTIEEIIELSPVYSPVEGLPAEIWESQTCSGCHEWTPERLCEQAGSYVDAEPERYQEKLHPFGGSFKINLRQWALNDCQ